MTERDRVLEAYRNCISEPKCKGCPWTECKTLGNATIEIPRDLALAVMRELVAQEPVKPIFAAGDGTTIGQFLCGKCHAKIGLGHPHFCWYCGRKVKWE